MYQYHTLSNGIKIVFRHSTSAVAYSGVYINIGSRDEQGPYEGIAHFIEHSIFKGTEHRKAYHIINRIDGVGGELNAYTTKEETCIYASSLCEHIERCLELFADVLFHSIFPYHELEKEKEVVIEEINSYRDAPADLIYDDFEELIYAGHPLAHNILGTKKNVRHFTPSMVSEYMHQNYTTNRMAISVVGNIHFDKLIRLCEKHFGHYTKKDTPSLRNTAPTPHTFSKTINRHTHQAHLLLGCIAPNLYDNDKVAFTLINNMLGGPAMNSRLNMAIRERYGFCYTIESQFSPLSDTGLFYIYAGVEPESVERVVELVENELDKMATTALSPQQLRAAQRQLIGQMAISNDIGMNEMQSIGKAILNYNHVDSLEEMNADIMSLKPAEIQQVAQKYFAQEKICKLCYL